MKINYDILYSKSHKNKKLKKEKGYSLVEEPIDTTLGRLQGKT